MKNCIAIIIFLCIESIGLSQNTKPVLYKDVVFKDVHIEKDLFYSNEEMNKPKYYKFDLYTPANDSSISKKPLIIWMHGGGFKFGTKNAAEIKLWGNEFAKRGYAFAAINYRLSKKNTLFKFKDLVEACYNNVEDANKAITYFKANAAEFNIDTNKIILGGNSAGSIIAIQTVYSNAADIKNILDSNKTVANTHNYNKENIAAVINFWGAIFNDAWLVRANAPIISVHGAKDKTVPLTHKGVVFFGSEAIHTKADSLHIVNAIKIYAEYAHELHKHFNPLIYSKSIQKRHIEAAQFASNFLYETLLR